MSCETATWSKVHSLLCTPMMPKDGKAEHGGINCSDTVYVAFKTIVLTLKEVFLSTIAMTLTAHRQKGKTPAEAFEHFDMMI